MRKRDLKQNPNPASEKAGIAAFLATKLVERLRPKENMPNFVCWALGGALTGVKPYRNIFFMQTPPSSQAHTMLEIVGEIMGDYAIKVSPSVFKNLKHDKSLPYRLRGKRMIYCTDFPDNGIISEGVIKTLCDNEEVCLYSSGKIHHIYLPAKIYIHSTGYPKIVGCEDAVLRRMWFIPVLGNPPATLTDSALLDSFRKEASGILNWLLEGAKWFLEDPNLSENNMPFQELAEVLREMWILQMKNPSHRWKGQTQNKNRL
jgi:phage/plasmid-associated DNA primase